MTFELFMLGDVVIMKDEIGNNFGVVLSGALHAYEGDAILDQNLFAGHFFGFAALLKEPNEKTLRAFMNCEIAVITIKNLHRVLELHQDVEGNMEEKLKTVFDSGARY